MQDGGQFPFNDNYQLHNGPRGDELCCVLRKRDGVGHMK